MRVVTAREFNQDTSRTKRLANEEPVFVTDRGRPTHVLLSIDVYRRLSGGFDNILDLIGAPVDSAPLVPRNPRRSFRGRG